jgi:hypothetical protein
MSETRTIRALILTIFVCMVAMVSPACTQYGAPGCVPGVSTLGCPPVPPKPPTPIAATIADPTGDTCNASCADGPATGTTIYDITQVASLRTGPVGGTYATIAVTVTFAQPVVIPAAGTAPDGAGADLVALVYFDIDNNPSDGSNFALCGANGTYLGVDYLINASTRLADGNYPIDILPAVTQTGEATVQTNGDVITYTLPISAIGNNPTGPFNLGMTAGNSQTPSDCAANGGFTPAIAIGHPMKAPEKASSPWWKL